MAFFPLSLRWFAALLLPLAGAACSISLAENDHLNVNSCSSSDECGSNGVCNQGMCVTTKADMTGLLIQIDVPSTAPFAPGVSTLANFASEPQLFGQKSSGLRQPNDIVAPSMTLVHGSLTIDADAVQPACQDLLAPNGSFPIKMELRPAPPVAALPLPSYATKSSAQQQDNGVSLSVPSGDYDVYFIPQIPGETSDDKLKYADCHMPPTVLPRRTIGQSNVSIGVSVQSPSQLQGTIDGVDLDGWTLKLLDNNKGRPLSETVTLTTVAATTLASFELHYWDELIQSEQVDAVIQLAPPESLRQGGMPTLLWKLAAVDLDGDNNIALNISALAAISAAPLKVSGSVYNGGSGVPAVVRIQSNKLLDGNLGGNAFYDYSIPTESDGSYQATLLPGHYTLTAVPASDLLGFAITSTTLDLNSETLGGALGIEVNPKSNLTATAIAPNGDLASGINAWLQPATTQAATYIESSLLVSPLEPAGVTAITDFNGGFNLEVDPGLYDLSVRPASGSGLPWLVRPRLAIQPVTTPTTASLGDLQLSYPLIIEGVVRSPEGLVLPGTLVRAWLAASSDETTDVPAPSAVQVAETISDGSGRYQLLLPASLSQ